MNPSTDDTAIAPEETAQPVLPTRNSSSSQTVIILIALVVIIVGIEGYFGFNYLRDKGYLNQSISTIIPSISPTQTLPPTPSPTPIILKAGKEIYSVSQGKHAGPAVSQVTFDPLDVKKGETLTVSATASDTATVTSVTGNLKTDGGSQSFTLSKTKDDGAKSIWVGTVTLESTVWYSYILTITASSTNGTNSVTVAPRS